MQYKPEMEAIQMTENSNMPPSYRVVMSNNPEIKRTRKNLIIILGVCLGLTLSSAIYHIGNGSPFGLGIGYIISECTSSIILCGFGIFCAHRYSSLGLRIFAWINVVGLVFLTIGIVILLSVSSKKRDVWLMNIEKDSSNQQGIDLGSVLIVSIAISAVIVSIIIIIIIRLSFKLARLINAN